MVSFIADVAYQPGTLANVVKDLASFLMPYAVQARRL